MGASPEFTLGTDVSADCSVQITILFSTWYSICLFCLMQSYLHVTTRFYVK